MEREFRKERVLLGQGKMARVYGWRGFAYKCFQKGYPENGIAYEMQTQSAINATGLPTVAYYPSELPHSIKMDLVDGITLADRIRQEKYENGLEDLLALSHRTHEVTKAALPDLSPFLEERIGGLVLDAVQKEAALRYLAEIPEQKVLCHMDHHFLNVMYGHIPQEEAAGYYLIDWVGAKLGNPVFDYARTYVILYEFANRLSGKYLRMVREQCGFADEVLQKAIYVMAVHRLSECESGRARELILKNNNYF